jgi:hypothetical protein
MEVTVLPPPLCPRTGAAAATPVPLARTLRIRLNHACLSRPDAAAAAKKPIWPGCSHGKEPTATPHIESADEKENKNASAVPKIGNLLRPCSRGDEVPRSPLDGNTNPCAGGAATLHTAAPPAAKRKATTADSGQAKRRASLSRVPFATTKKQQLVGDGAASTSPSPRSSDSEGTVRALLARARPASDAIRMRDTKRLRAQARWELDQVVQTVEFNDAFLTPQDVLK